MEKHMPNEKIYYQDPDVTITNARAIFGHKTYAISNITSVVKGVIEPIVFFWLILALLALGAGVYGSVILYVSILEGRREDIEIAYGIIFVAVMVLILSILFWRNAKPTWVVKISSASGEVDAFKSTDEARIQSIITGINQSIIDRG